MTDFTVPRLSPWRTATAMSLTVVLVGLVAFSLALSIPAEFAVAVLAVLAIETVIFYHANRTARQDAGRQQFTLATALTVLRGSAILILVGFVVVGRPDSPLSWAPALLFGAGALFDGVDGAVARARGAVSAFGARVDVEVDALALLVGTLLAVRIGSAPAVFLLVGIARYAFICGLTLRRCRGRPVSTLPPRFSRRVLGAFGMIVVFVVLTPVFDPSVTRPLAVAAMVPFLLGFCRDWMLVTGRL